MTLKKMPGVLCMCFLGLFLFLTATQPVSAQMKLGFKLGGGAGLLFNGGGDLEKVRLGHQQYMQDVLDYDYYSSTFNWNKMSFAPHFDFEVILAFGRNFGLGFGTGYVSGKSTGDYSFTYDASFNPWWGTYWETEVNTYARTYNVSAIPIRLNFYFFMPMGSMTFYGFGGLGYYIGNLSHEYTYDYTENYEDSSWYYWNEKEEFTYNFTSDEKAKANALGFQGGVGLKVNFTPAVGIAFELFGRLVNFKNWTGDYSDTNKLRDRWWHELVGWYYDYSDSWTDEDDGTLYYYEYHDMSDYYARMWVMEDKPSGSSYKNVRPAAINLNAFGLSVTLFILFDLF